MLFELWRKHMPGRWILLAVLVISQVVDTLMSLWLPTLNAQIINLGVIPGDVPLIWRLGGLMLLITVAQSVAMILSGYLAGRIAMWIGKDIRQQVYEHVLGFGSSEMRRFSPASLITRATNDVNQVQNVIFMTFIIMIQAPILGIGALVMAISLDAPLSMLFLVAVPVLALVVGLIMRAMSPLFKEQQERIDEVAGRIRTALSGMRMVRAFGRKGFMESRFEQSNQDLKTVALRVTNLFALMMPVIQLIVAASSVAVVWLGAWRYLEGGMPIGNIVAFLTYLMQILGAVMMASFMFVMVPRAEVSAKRLQEVIKTIPEVKSPDKPKPLPEGPLTITFDNVTMQFEGASRPLLAEMNFTIEPGKVTAVIGSTGTGKTTLLRLLARSLDPSSGRVLVNGVNLRELSLEEWHSRHAVVEQTTYLFSGTIATTVSGLETEAITPEIRDQIESALKSAQAWEFVSALEEGMDAEVNEGGKNFSGGQRQRLAVARALFRRAPLLVLDDPFSALDFATEAQLRGEFERLGEGVTQVLVAQRVASVRHADQVIVLDGGQVVGIGTHETLLEKCETYQEIVKSQLTLEEVL